MFDSGYDDGRLPAHAAIKPQQRHLVPANAAIKRSKDDSGYDDGRLPAHAAI
jgi:hypothetical protein